MTTEDTQLAEIFPDLERQLSSVGAPMRAAESHGLLCAHFCVESRPDFENWAMEVIGPVEEGSLQLRECLQTMGELYKLSGGLFGDDLDSFIPMLPADEVELTVRNRALIDWCTGFVSGLGTSGMADEDTLAEETQEILKDLIEITRMDEGIEQDEENEAAFVEVVEYVRIGVMTIWLSIRHAIDQRTLH